MALTPAEKVARHRAKERGEEVPPLKSGPKSVKPADFERLEHELMELRALLKALDRRLVDLEDGGGPRKPGSPSIPSLDDVNRRIAAEMGGPVTDLPRLDDPPAPPAGRIERDPAKMSRSELAAEVRRRGTPFPGPMGENESA